MFQRVYVWDGKGQPQSSLLASGSWRHADMKMVKQGSGLAFHTGYTSAPCFFFLAFKFNFLTNYMNRCKRYI